MKKLKNILIYSLAILTLIIAVGYYLLWRPYENIRPADSISFEDIEPGDPGMYPVKIRSIDALREKAIIEKDVAIVMEDGVSLSANVFRPIKEGRYPVVMSFTAYDKDKGPESYPPPLKASYLPDFNLGTFEVSPWTMWEAPDPAFWLSHGYAVVQVNARGYFKSEGAAGLFDERNIMDFHHAITWAGTQPWSNGNVGLNGVSYLAIAQWVAATGDPPTHLKAIIPWEGNTDAFREVLYHGGIPETVFTRFWVNRVRDCANSDKPLPPFFLFRLGHKNPGLLRKINPPPQIRLDEIKVPALICATWSDQGLHSRGSFEGFKQISSEDKWLFTHGRQKWSVYYSDEALDLQKRFFDHFLKGEDNGMDTVRSVRLEVRESLDQYQVRFEETWPVPGTEYRKLYLENSEGSLRTTPAGTAEAAEYDPFESSASYTYRFDEDTELTGNMKLKLWVSTSKGSDMDLFVAVKKLDTLGREVFFYAKTGYNKGSVSMGWLRVSERSLDKERSTDWQPVLSHQNPQELSKGEIVAVHIEILPGSTLFRKGESLQLVVQGKDLFTHPAMGHHYSVNKGTHALHAGGQYDSHLLVPVVR